MLTSLCAKVELNCNSLAVRVKSSLMPFPTESFHFAYVFSILVIHLCFESISLFATEHYFFVQFNLSLLHILFYLDREISTAVRTVSLS